MRMGAAPGSSAFGVFKLVQQQMVLSLCVGQDDSPIGRLTAKTIHRRIRDDQLPVRAGRWMVAADGRQAGQSAFLAAVAVDQREGHLNNGALIGMPSRMPPTL